jgi:hypothetical protein
MSIKLYFFSYSVNLQSEEVVQGNAFWRRILVPFKTHCLTPLLPSNSLDLPNPQTPYVQSTQKATGFLEYLGVLRKKDRLLDRGATKVVF